MLLRPPRFCAWLAVALASPAVSPSQEQPFHGIKIGIGALPQSDMLSRERGEASEGDFSFSKTKHSMCEQCLNLAAKNYSTELETKKMSQERERQIAENAPAWGCGHVIFSCRVLCPLAVVIWQRKWQHISLARSHGSIVCSHCSLARRVCHPASCPAASIAAAGGALPTRLARVNDGKCARSPLPFVAANGHNFSLVDLNRPRSCPRAGAARSSVVCPPMIRA